MKSLFRKITATSNSWSPLIARLALGSMILPHGLQKTLGLFGGYGFQGTMNFFTETMHIPWIFGLAAILAESLGGIALLLGLQTRLAAFGVGATMAVAMFTTHLQNGFFMNWFGHQKGEGIEFFILAIALALVLMLDGGGRLSADKKLAKVF